MTLEKAIELLEEMPRVIDHQKLIDLPDAIKLGIEALKAWKFVRADRPRLGLRILPGETEE